MARHKMTKKKKAVSGVKHRRKRRVSGVSGGLQKQAINTAGVIVGAIGGRIVRNVMAKNFPTFSPLMAGAVQVGIGFALPMLVKNNALVADIGLGMSAEGGLSTAMSLGIIAGPGDNQLLSYQVYPGSLNGIEMVSGPTSRIGDDGADFSIVSGGGTNYSHTVS